MKLSELRFIDQDIIDKGGINVTSPEMYDEARRYNMSMVTNAAKKKRVDVVTGSFFLLQIPVVFMSMVMFLYNATLSDFAAFGAGDFAAITSYARLGALLIGVAAYMFLFISYVIVKGIRDPKVVFLCSAPLLMTTLGCMAICAVNFVLAKWYEVTYEKLVDEAGYPAFSRLSVTTVDSDSKYIKDVTYDSIKERAKKLRPDDDNFL